MKKFAEWFVGSAICLILSTIAVAQTSSFTYQGKLADSGAAANGTYDITFKLYDALANGTQVGNDIVREDVVVTDGEFNVDLDFGAASFANGSPRFLQLEVRPGSSTTAFIALVPRQPLTSSPFAVKAAYATSADTLSDACILCIRDEKIDTVGAGKVTGVLSYLQGGTGLGGPGPFPVAGLFLRSTGTGLGLQGLTASDVPNNSVTTPKIVDGSVTAPKIADGAVTVNGLGDNAVITQKIADGAVTRSKLAINFRNGFDPQQVALQRWDQIPVVPRFWEVGRTPSALAFDGTFIYVASKLDNNVQRIRASTGQFEGAPITDSISAPTALVYDGTFVHVANSGGPSISRIRASTGEVETEVGLGCNPIAMVYDGTYLYVACSGSKFLKKLFAATYANGGTIDMISNPAAMVYDGSSVYVTTVNPLPAAQGEIKRINSDTTIDTVASTPGTALQDRAMAFDGTFIYSSFGIQVFRIRKSSGLREVLNISFPGTIPGSEALNNYSLVFDGTYVFGSGIGKTWRLSPTGLAPEQSIPIDGRVTALIFDGTYVYAAADRMMTTPQGTTVILNGGVTRIPGGF